MPTHKILALPLLFALASCQFMGHQPSTQVSVPPPLAHIVPQASAEPLVTQGDLIEQTASEAVKAVVFIHAQSRVDAREANPLPFFFGPQGFGVPDQPSVREGAGSGVLVDPSGLILTNFHVIRDATQLQVTLADGKRYEAEIVGTDEATDLALIKLKGKTHRDLPILELGDSDAVRLGQTVLAIGAPFALQGSVTQGIISARGRAGMGLSRYENFLQTDAAINPGNSGGALVSLDGKLIGINTAISTRSGGYDGIGFAVPSNLAKQIMDALRKDGRVIRGYLGVGIQDVDPSFAEALKLDDGVHGALVSYIEPGSPAQNAKLEVGDVLVAIDGIPVPDANALRNTVSLRGSGQAVTFDVLRDGKPLKVSTTLDAMPEDRGKGGSNKPVASTGLLEGLRITSVAEVARQLGPDAPEAGAVIVRVEPGSHAARSGLGVGDVVVEVDRKPVDSPQAFQRALTGKDRALLLVQRSGVTHFVYLE